MNDTEYRNSYLLMTPGPLSTTEGVRRAMMRDWCTWDDDYKEITQNIRSRLIHIGECTPDNYTAVLLQGSGTYVVESVLTTVLDDQSKLLILENGAYGRRMATVAKTARIPFESYSFGETNPVDPEFVAARLDADPSITHVALVHCETTTGMVNPLQEIVHVIKQRGRYAIVDAMSSFGGMRISVEALNIDFLISSANKCIQGVPGFGFVIANTNALAQCEGRSRSHSLDLYDQWRVMEENNGKWRFTSPTHVVHAFHQALLELAAEGGIPARESRYVENQRRLVEGMNAAGFSELLPNAHQSPIITSFLYPTDDFSFEEFYQSIKKRGYVIYPGKLTEQATFRIGTIGDIHPSDIDRFVSVVAEIVGTKR
ncbi:2-aminoethylphosphonate--pyruvate transaminase [Alicyclobacillus dauci]|uniref:2-aminoethylphosphonate--pyruvate transaminase n=1 Tax=Alicyclobacillus dauci TaxID=1475485 RepID=A0ABY6Z1B8_9BACL|nr:2-aminoethylphosphonate--pyruvate transaminase [Alicyclobacillus dauci]WAH36119.1 2-aminoethylphosphonate--pyruvate transaminase [Alicyclobacillus dauci]